MFITLKIICAIVIAYLVVTLATDTELAIHLGTFALIFVAALTCFFSKTLSVRAQAFFFLILAIRVSRGVDRYFWVGVWNHDYPWPYSHGADCPSCGGHIGSVAPFMNEVATVCFSILTTIAAIAITWHLASKRSPCRAE